MIYTFFNMHRNNTCILVFSSCFVDIKKHRKLQQLTELIYISLYKQEYQKYNPDQDQQIKQLAENHGRQMEYLQLRNQDLEKQRQGRYCVFPLWTFLNKLNKIWWLIFIYIFHLCVSIDIQRRLAALGNKGRPTGGEDSAQLLAELRAQEERNQRSLDDLKRQLYDINHQRINVM